MSGPVLVTGGGGFIGRAVAADLAATGQAVRIGTRAGAGGTTACDPDRPETLAPALAGAEAVVHAAYGDLARMPAQLDALLKAADDAGVRRLVFYSTVLVSGARTGDIRETDGPLGRLDPYGAGKAACEARIAAWAGRGGRRAVVLRPGPVTGRGSRFFVDKLALRIRAGRWGTFGAGGEGFAGLVHVADVAAATRLALAFLEGPGAPVETLHVSGPDLPSWNGYFRALARHLGALPLREIGAGELRLLQALALPAKALARMGVTPPGRFDLVPPPGEMSLYARKAVYLSDRAAEVLGWHPAVGMEEGLRRSLSEPDDEMAGRPRRHVEPQAAALP